MQIETPNDPLKIAVYEWRVPYGLVWKHCFMCCSDLHASNCGMLETCFLCCNSTFFFTCTVEFLFRLFVFWQEFSLFLIWCAFYLLCCLLWPWFLEMRLDIACTFLHGKCNLLDYHFYKCHFFKTGLVLQWSSVWQHKGCWCDVLWSHSGLSLSTDVPKNILFFIIILEKKDHTQSWCFVLCVSISLF